jgi:SAM-dependent methyltransferase
MDQMPRLYGDLAGWFHLLTAPADYAVEAAEYERIILEEAPGARTLLELGSGGGNNASHLKDRFTMTLVDRSPDMLAVSRRLNPGCRHLEGDMRSVHLGEEFDVVFVHDAVSYLTTLDDLRAAMETARRHLSDRGVALFVPDLVTERFSEAVDHGGHDQGDRTLRYLEWRWDPDPDDATYVLDMVYLMRDGGETTAVHDRHTLGLFTTEEWLAAAAESGFDGRLEVVPMSDGDPLLVFVLRPDGVTPAS